MNNLILKTDSYKVSHAPMYPEGTQNVYSYFESRVGAKYPKTVFFGLQAILMKHLVGRVIEPEFVVDAARIIGHHLGPDAFNRQGWEYIVKNHNGRLPLRIRAVPEGSVNDVSTVLMTVEATDPECYWLTNYMETLLSQVWYPSTVASLSYHVRQIIEAYLLDTTGTTDGVEFMLHDFGCRGVETMDAAAMGGMAHLVNFMGTDTMPALFAAEQFYRADLSTLGFSVPASEHSVMTAITNDEEAIVARLLEKFPTGIISCVGDSYDIYNFVDHIVGEVFHDQIMERDGKFVVRPDSPTPRHPNPADQVAWILDSLACNFGGGYTTNELGYDVLDPHVGVLWGDGIDVDGIEDILETATKISGFAASNLVFGMGGGLLQKVNRDTQRFAFKCSAQLRDGVWYDVSKNPLDPTKKSKSGRFDDNDKLVTVFEDGKLVKHYNFDEVRANARRG